jgi:hypothetical protein
MDFTPTYLYSREALERIKAYNPNAKVVVVLRNPIKRHISHYFDLLNWTKSAEIEPLQSGDIIVKRGRFDIKFNLFDNSDYKKYIDNVYDIFPKDNVCVLFFEHLQSKPIDFYTKLMDFLEVDSNLLVKEIKYGKVYNYRHSIKSKKIQSFLSSEILRDLYSYSPEIIKRMLIRLYERLRRVNCIASHSYQLSQSEMKSLTLKYKDVTSQIYQILPEEVNKYWRK